MIEAKKTESSWDSSGVFCINSVSPASYLFQCQQRVLPAARRFCLNCDPQTLHHNDWPSRRPSYCAIWHYERTACFKLTLLLGPLFSGVAGKYVKLRLHRFLILFSGTSQCKMCP
ncbi:hypothetical protein ElyMa_004569500 [Elysia marginata]|uniref:Uncharacterized protein n=1 Tax=Elysia marginata TaxID=1093978 RepID=A0AAV4HUR4_9GAST|nr:hypothetical protein ElyMa_004569500 [Elysia marginata]